jgi:tetratricopeptide (TPR) repeat protein
MVTIKKRGPAAVKQQPEQEIISLAHKASEFMAKYRKLFTIVVSACAAVIILGAGYFLLRAQQEQKAEPLVAAAYEYYSPANGSAADYGKALELFREIQKKYSGTRSAAIAQYYAGNCLSNLGQPEEALKAYGAFVQNYSGEKFLLGLVYQRMGYAYKASGRPEDARKSFEQADALLGPGAATMELARSYEAAGNKAEAEKKYKVVLDKLGGTSWGIEAMGKVQKTEPAPLPSAGAGTK